MSACRLEADFHHTKWSLHGELTFATVSSLHERALQLFSRRVPLTVDLAAVERADSSSVALLVDWKRRARRAGTQVRFINAPPLLGRIAALYGLLGVLGVYAPDEG